ncbi:MAG TPA: CNP1-like family protein [Gammaproteobacteria bacterium]
MSKSHARLVLAGLLLAWLACAPATAGSVLDEHTGFRDTDTEPEKDDWKERLGGLPAYPDGKHYVEVPLQLAGSDLDMFIDEPALSIGEDGVVRYTLLLRSPTGAENLFYEGIRCATREWRSYAYGTSAGEWRALGDAPWRGIRDLGVERYRLELYRYYLCHPTSGPRLREEMLRRMRYGVPADESMGIKGN